MRKFQTGTSSLEDVLEYYSTINPSVKVVQQDDMGYAPLSSYGYDEGLAYGMNQNKLRAANQSFFDEIAWSAANSIPSTLFSIPEYFTQLYGMGAALYDGGKTSEEISNFFRPLKTWGDLYQLYTGEENSVGKVYTEGDNRAWWTEAIVSGLPSSIASFGVVGAGIGRIVSGGTALIHNNLLRAVGQNASKLSTGIANFTNVGLTASALTGIEASMTGADVRSTVRQRFNTDAKFKQEIIQQGLREGRSPEEVLEERMQKGYDTAFNTAFTTNLALNLTGVGALLKPANKIKSAVNNAAKQAINTGEDVLQAVDNVRIPNQLIKPNLIGEAVQEGVEEFTQVVAQEAGKGVAFNNDPEGFIAAITKYGSKAFSGEGAASFILGALGGIGQKYISEAVGGENIQEQLETYKLKFADDVKTVRSATDRIKELANSPEDNAKEIEYLQRELYKVSLSRALMNDNIDVLINELKGIQQLPNDKTIKQIANEEFVKFHSTLDNETFNMFQNEVPENIPAELKEQYTKFKELEKKVINSPNLTPAQNAGLVEFNDEQLELLGINKDYVRTSGELINDLKSSYKEWKNLMDKTNPQTLEDYMYNLEIFLLQKDLEHLNLKQREEESKELQTQEKELQDKIDSFFNTNELDNTKPFEELIKDIESKSLIDTFTELTKQKTDFISKNKDKIRAIQIANETSEELKKLLTKEGKEEWLKNYNKRKEVLNKSVKSKLDELNKKDYETRDTDDILKDEEISLEDKKNEIIDRLDDELRARKVTITLDTKGGKHDLIDKDFVSELLARGIISIDKIKEVSTNIGSNNPVLRRRYVLIDEVISFLNSINDSKLIKEVEKRLLTIKDVNGKEYHILSLDNPTEIAGSKAVKVDETTQEDTTLHKVFAYEAIINLGIDVSDAPMYVVVPKDANNLKVGIINIQEDVVGGVKGHTIRVVQQRYELEASNKYSALADALRNEEGEGHIINYRPLKAIVKSDTTKIRLGQAYYSDIIINYTIANSLPKGHPSVIDVEQLIAHEVFHVMNKKIVKNLGKEAKKIVTLTNQRIKEIHEYLKKTDKDNYFNRFKFIYNQIDDPNQTLSSSGLYEEFINEVLTNKEFQDYLKSKSFDHKSTVFQKVLEYIKSLFKSILPTNLYQVSVSIIDDLYKGTNIIDFAIQDAELDELDTELDELDESDELDTELDTKLDTKLDESDESDELDESDESDESDELDEDDSEDDTKQKDTDSKKSSSFTNEELVQVAQAIKDGTYKELELENKEEILKYINRLVSDEGGKRDVVLDNIINKEKNELYQELYQAMDSGNKEAIQKVKAKIEAKYGNKTFQELRKKANNELKHRGTYKPKGKSDTKIVKEIIKDLSNRAPREREILISRFPKYKYQVYKRNETYINEELAKIDNTNNNPIINDTGDVVDNSPSRMIYYDVSEDAEIVYNILQNEITDKAVEIITKDNTKKDIVKDILIRLKNHRESGATVSLEITIPELNSLNGTILRNLFYVKDNLAYTYFSPATSKFKWNNVQANNFRGLELLLSKNKNEDGTLDTSNIEFKYIKYKSSNNINEVVQAIFGNYPPSNTVLTSDYAGYIQVRNKDTDEIFYTRLNARDEASIPEDIKQALESNDKVLLQLKDNIPASFRLIDEFNTLNDVFDFPVTVQFVRGKHPVIINRTTLLPGEAYIQVNGRVLEVAGKELNKEKEILDNIINQIKSLSNVNSINELIKTYIYVKEPGIFNIKFSLDEGKIKYSINGSVPANLFTKNGIAKKFITELAKRRFNITQELIDNPRLNELVVVNVPKKTEVQYKSPFITFEVNANQTIESESINTQVVETEEDDDWGTTKTNDEDVSKLIKTERIDSEGFEISLEEQDEIYNAIPLNEQDTLSLLEGMTSVLFEFLDKQQLPVTSLLERNITQDNIYTAIHKLIYNPDFGKRLNKEQKAKLKPIFTDNNIWEKVKQAHKIYLSNKYDIEPANIDDEVQEDSKDSAFDRESFTISNDSRYSTRTRLLLSTLSSGKVNSLGLNSPAQFREVYTVVSRIGVGKYGLGKQSFKTIIEELNKVDKPWAKQLVNRLHFEPEERTYKEEQMMLKANFLGDLDRAYITQWYYDYEAGTIVNMHRVSIANGMINDFKIALQNLAKGGNTLTIQGTQSFMSSVLNNAVNEEFKGFTYDIFLNARKGVIIDKVNKKVSININNFIEDIFVRAVFLDHIDKHPELLKSDNVISRFDGKLAYAISLRTVAHDIIQQINEGVYVTNDYSEGSGLIELAKTKPINISVLIGIKGTEDVQANRLTEGERIAVDIMAYKKQGMLLTPAHSDKSTNYFITALSGRESNFGVYMTKLFKTELKIWYNNLGGKNKNNLIFYNEYFTKSELEAIRVRLDNGESIDTIYNEEIRDIEEYYNEFYQEELDRVKQTIRNIQLPIDNNDLENYVRATIIQNMDLFRIIYGDPRYFKNVQDVNKRIPYIFSTKLFMVDDEEIRKDLKRIDGKVFNFLDREDKKYENGLDDFNKTTQMIIKSEVGASSNIDSIKQSVNLLIEEGIINKDDVSALYEDNIDKTDAVAFVTLDEFRELKWRAQDWNLELEKLYWRIRRGDEIKDAKVVFKPIKGQYGHNSNGRPIYDKTLFIPLIPEVIKGTRLEKVNNYMKANKIGYMVFDSGYKIPLDQDITTFDELIAHIDNVEDSKVPYSEVIDYSGMGIQVLMGNTKEDKGPFPTQINGIQTLDQAVNALIKQEEQSTVIEQGVEELFESNPELANAIYEALGFDNNVVFETERGSVYYLNNGKTKRDKKTSTGEIQKFSESDKTVYITEEDFKILRENSEGLKDLEWSNNSITVTNGFDRKTTISVKNNPEIGLMPLELVKGIEETETGYREDKRINIKSYSFLPNNVNFHAGHKIVSINSQITPQQKQEAQSKFQEYVNLTGRKDIAGFKEFVSNKTNEVQKVEKNDITLTNNEFLNKILFNTTNDQEIEESFEDYITIPAFELYVAKQLSDKKSEEDIYYAISNYTQDKDNDVVRIIRLEQQYEYLNNLEITNPNEAELGNMDGGDSDASISPEEIKEKEKREDFINNALEKAKKVIEKYKESLKKEIVIYHSSPAQFTRMSKDFIGTGTGDSFGGYGFYFTDTKPNIETNYGTNLYQVKVDKSKLLDIASKPSAELLDKINSSFGENIPSNKNILQIWKILEVNASNKTIADFFESQGYLGTVRYATPSAKIIDWKDNKEKYITIFNEIDVENITNQEEKSKNKISTITKQERLDRLKQAYNDWYELEVRNLEKEFGIYNGKIIDYELFYDKVQNLLDTSDRDIKRSLNTDRSFILNPYAGLIQNKINSILEKRLINREFTGAGYLQTSTIGMEYEGENIRVDKKLKFYRYEGGDSTLPAEAAIPLPSELKYLLDKYGTIEAINEAYQAGKIKKVILSGARIPVQGYPSMEVFEVKYFLPPHVSYIIVPEEITKKAGSDFDGDKLYLFRRTSKSITYDKDTHYKRYVAQNVSDELSKLKALYKKRKDIDGEWEEVRLKLDELSNLYKDIMDAKFDYANKRSVFIKLPDDIRAMYKMYDSNLEYTGKLKQLSYLEFTNALINTIKQANLEKNKVLNQDYYGISVVLSNELIPILEKMIIEYEQSIRDIEAFQNDIREKLTEIKSSQKSILDEYKLEKSTNLNDILEASGGLKGIELFKKLAKDNGLTSYEEFNEYYHTKEELQNEILDNFNGLLLDKTNYTSLVSSVDTNNTKDWLERNGKEVDNTIKEYKDLASVTKQNTVWFNNNSGKRLVGIFARHNKHHSFAQQIGMKLRNKLVNTFAFKSSIRDGEVSFADIFNTQGIKISSGIGEHISMSVDIAKGDYLSPAGVRENSASLKMLFARAGVSNDLINNLFTHPTVVKFFNAMSINRLRPKYDRNEKRSKIHQALMAIGMEYGVDNNNKPKNGVFSYTTIDGVKFINPLQKEQINFDNLSKLSDTEIIGKLLEMMKIADDLNTVMDFNNPDTKGLDISYFNNIVHAIQKKDAKSMFVDADGNDALHSINNNTVMFPFNQGQRLGALINNELFAFSSTNTPAKFIEKNKKDINNSKSTYIYKLTYENYITKLVEPKRKINVEKLASKLKNIFTTLKLESKIDNETSNILRIKESKLDDIERQERKNTIMDMYSKGELTNDDLIDLAVLSLRQNKFGSVANILQVIPYKAFELLDYNDNSDAFEIELDSPPIFTQDVLEYQLFKVNSQLKLCK